MIFFYIVPGNEYYYIQTLGHDDTLKVEKYDDSELVYQAKVKVKTIGVEKTNTIAIYETNGTAFNGHYQEQEQMNIIQLYVNDSGASTPSVEESNVIVIPTSLFTETVFNAHVQNETLDETPIYSADDEIFKFISVGRDGDTEQACDEIDSILIRFEISSEDAMEILNLLLECLVNETTNETAIVYSYASTKLNGTSSVMMNLPISVLGFVPWFCEKESSPFGKKPRTKKQALAAPLKKLVSFVAGVIIVIGMAILELVELIADFVMEILMEWLPILEFILWLIICAIILIFAFIILAISLIMTISSNLILGIMSLILAPLLGAKVKFGLFFIEIKLAHSKIRIDTKVNWKYIKFFRLTLPYLTETIKLNETIIKETKSGILGFYSEEQEIESDTKLDLFNGKYSPNSTSVETVDISFSSEDEHAPDLSFIEQSPTRGLSECKYTFKVKYSDIDGDAPSEDYGVKLILISPLGDAKEYNMITKDTSPDYETGVVFECVIGDDKDEKLLLAGIWHFYFVAEDTDSLKTALIEDDDTAFDGPTITLDLESFSTMFFWYTLFCGIIPMALFSLAGDQAYKQQNQLALILGLSGLGLGVGASLFMTLNILGDIPTYDAWGKIGKIPIIKGVVDIDAYSGFWGALVACSFITVALLIVLCHKFDLTKIYNIGDILYHGQSLDLLLLVFSKFNMNAPLLFSLIFTGAKTVLSFGALLVSSIMLCRNIYGLNWIVKNKDGTMNNNLRHKTVPENVKRIPKIYCGWMFTMTLVFIICVAIMHGYRFNAQIE